MRKVCAMLVPKLLNGEHMNSRVKVAGELLERVRNKAD